jgi:hypothetical protein
VVESVKRAVSWLVVFAVGLAPMLAYWVTGLIGRAFPSKGGGRGTGSRAARYEEEEPAERRDPARPG